MQDNDLLIFYGDKVKSLDSGKLGGYLVRFTDADTPDLEGDYFTKDTDLGAASMDGAKIPLYYHHGFNKDLKNKRIGFGTVKLDETGVWLESQIELHDEYEAMIRHLVDTGKLGYSSGAAGHLVDREQVGESNLLKVWPVGEASLTPTPAEWRNTVISVKTLMPNEPEETQESEEGNKMTEEVKAPEVKQEKFEIDYKALIQEAAEAAVKKLHESEPAVKAGVQVIEDEADKALRENPFTPGEFFKAVYIAGVSNQTDKRLLPLMSNDSFKATGANEAIPSQGGFLVTPDIASGIHEQMWGVGRVLSQFNAMNVAGNGLTINAIDETSRADGSRMGGLLGYWLAEAAEKTASQPKFRQIELKLKKVAALVYATDELLQDAGALEGWINQNVPNELRFMVEDSIIDGDGIGKPLGILQSGALISATRTDASQVDADDIGRMWSQRYPAVQDYVWFVNASVLPQLYRMTIADGGYTPIYTPPGGLSVSPYGQLLGRPVIETEYNPYLGTVGDILLASPSQYALITKAGIQAASSIHVRFIYDESCFRFVYRVDGSPLWASYVTAFDGTHTVSPFVALAAST